jgi:putative Mn2+ efflux pump MntP
MALFVLNSILLGIGLAVDAFSVSVANAISEPDMKKSRMCMMAGVFAAFQALMPMTGWICVHTVVQYLRSFDKAVPWIAFILLAAIGIKMIAEGVRNKEEAAAIMVTGVATLVLQGVATSIDALSVGFAIAHYETPMALLCSLIIAAVTFIICTGGILIGKKVGALMSSKATVLGGIILIFIGVEILFTNIF